MAKKEVLTIDENDTIKVRATRTVFYEHARRREGDVFVLRQRIITETDPKTGRALLDDKKQPKQRILTAEEQFSCRSMERVDDDEPEHTTTAQEALDKAADELKPQTATGRKAASRANKNK